MTSFIKRVRNSFNKVLSGAAPSEVDDKRSVHSPEIEQAAESGDLEAMLHMARCYEEGLGVARDAERAWHFWSMAADLGHFGARLKMMSRNETGLEDIYGDFARNGPMDEKTFLYSEEVEKAARAGDVNAMLHTGVSYYEGLGVEMDRVKGLGFWGGAAMRGHSGAQYFMAMAFAFGYVAVRDRPTALFYATLSKLSAKNNAAEGLYRDLVADITDEERISYTHRLAEEVPSLLEDDTLPVMPPEIAFRHSPEAEREAQDGKAFALFHMGMSYTYGFGAEKDRQRGLNCWKAAREQGHAGAGQMIAKQVQEIVDRDYMRQDRREEDYIYFEEIEDAASAGNHRAMFYLRKSYQEGLGVERDMDRARRMMHKVAELIATVEKAKNRLPTFQDLPSLQKDVVDENGLRYSRALEDAAKAGDVKAMIRLAIVYDKGLGVAKNKALGLEQWLAAAQRNHHHAQYVAASILFKMGKKADALYWAAFGKLYRYPPAENLFDEIYAKSSEQERAEYTRRFTTTHPSYVDQGVPLSPRHIAFAYARHVEEAAEAGDAAAMFHMGMSHFYGAGVSTDQILGLDYWKAAQTQRHRGAAYMFDLHVEDALERHFMRDEPVPEKQILYSEDLEKAAFCGDVPAMLKIAMSYHKGFGVEKSATLAYHYWRTAASEGQAQAMFYVALAFERGVACPPDRAEALYWASFCKALGSKPGAGLFYHLRARVTDQEQADFRHLMEQRHPFLLEGQSRQRPEDATLH